jgi:hypothetical protein
MTALMHNNLRFYTLRITESPEMAEKKALEFEEKFNALNKYDQLDLAFKIELDGWESAFESIDDF